MTTPEPYPAEGGCDCQAVRYRMQTRPLFVHCCHCCWCQPDIHIFTASRQAWVQLPADAPAVAEYHDRDLYWPADSLQRHQALQPAIEAYQATLKRDA